MCARTVAMSSDENISHRYLGGVSDSCRVVTILTAVDKLMLLVRLICCRFCCYGGLMQCLLQLQMCQQHGLMRILG